MDININDVKQAIPEVENISELGNGGQKKVFKCVSCGNFFVVKFIQVEENNGSFSKIDKTAAERALRELNMMNSLKSPNLPESYPIVPGVFEKADNKYFYYGEKYIEGPTLCELIQNRIDYNMSKKLIIDVVTAINLLWSNPKQYVHRDIKPANIIYDKANNNFVLIDAGLALALTEVSLTPKSHVVGTLPYMSPEQIFGVKRKLDFRSDLYSLGITAYEAITGRHPYYIPGMNDQEIVRSIIDTVPPSLDNSVYGEFPQSFLDVIDTLIMKKPHQRYNSCNKVINLINI